MPDTPQFATNLVRAAWSALSPIRSPQTNGNQVAVTGLSAAQTQKFYRIALTYP